MSVALVPAADRSEDQLAFLPGVVERLGCYVYALVDPRDGRIFYVGKGKLDSTVMGSPTALKRAVNSAP
jgi:hypothetical protein